MKLFKNKLLPLIMSLFLMSPAFMNAAVYADDFVMEEEGSAEFSISATGNADTLANMLKGEGIEISNMSYTGHSLAAGTFSGGEDVIGFDEGIVLSSGEVEDVVGTGNTQASSGNGQAGDSDLSGLISGATTNDAAILEFDFVPQGDMVSFQYVIGSEEYPEYLNFCDVFGLFVNEENEAWVPNTNQAVSIGSVNHQQNSTYYICNNDHPSDPGTNQHLNTTLDGLTVVFSVSVEVNPGVNNHIKMAIADKGDSSYDSAVFIKGHSISNREAQPGEVSAGSKEDLGDWNKIYLERNNGNDGTISLDWAALNDEGQELDSGTVVFGDGETLQTIMAPENAVNLELSNISGGASIVVGGNVVSIDSLPPNPGTYPGKLQFSAENYNVMEDGSSIDITIVRTIGSYGNIEVDYNTTLDGTAAAAEDYGIISGTLAFGDGEISKTFTVPIIDDDTDEGNETISMTISNPTGGSGLGDIADAQITILEADVPNTDKSMLSWSFDSFDPVVNGVIDEAAGTVSVVVPAGSSISNIAPAIEISPQATVVPGSEVLGNFNSPVVYTVTAQDGSTRQYTITVECESDGGEEASTPPEISISGNPEDSDPMQNTDVQITADVSGSSAIAEVKWAAGDCDAAYLSQADNGTVMVENSGQYIISIAENGPYTIYARDSEGLESVLLFTVSRIDKTPPIIALNDSVDIMVERHGTYTEMGAQASDNMDGDISDDIIITGEVDETALGTYHIRYNVADSAGNAAAEVCRNVTVFKLDNDDEQTPPEDESAGDNASGNLEQLVDEIVSAGYDGNAVEGVGEPGSAGFPPETRQNIVERLDDAVQSSMGETLVQTQETGANSQTGGLSINLGSSLPRLGADIADIFNQELGDAPGDNNGAAGGNPSDSGGPAVQPDINTSVNVSVIQQDNMEAVYQGHDVGVVNNLDINNLSDSTNFIVRIDILLNGQVVGSRELVVTTPDRTPPVIHNAVVSGGRLDVEASDNMGLASDAYMYRVVRSGLCYNPVLFDKPLLLASTEIPSMDEEIWTQNPFVDGLQIGDQLYISVKDWAGNVTEQELKIITIDGHLYENVNSDEPLMLNMDSELAKKDILQDMLTCHNEMLQDCDSDEELIDIAAIDINDYDVQVNNEDIASFEGELLKINSPGSTFIVAVENNSGKTYVYYISVDDQPVFDRQSELEVGQEACLYNLYRNVLLREFGSLNDISFSTDDNKLNIGADGNITVSELGIARIYAGEGDKLITLYLKVSDGAKSYIPISRAEICLGYTVGEGQKLDISDIYSLYDTGGNILDIEYLLGESSNPNILEPISDHEMIAAGAGRALISIIDLSHNIVKHVDVEVEKINPADNVVQFDDIDHHWAESNINSLAAAGVVKGSAEGVFDTEANVSMQEFLAMYDRYLLLNRANPYMQRNNYELGLEKDAWSYYHINDILNNLSYPQIKYILGEDFEPGNSISRGQAAALFALDMDLQERGDIYFLDLSDCSFAEQVYRSAEAGIFEGYPDGNFEPDAFLSRAEMAAVIDRLDTEI